MTQHAASGPSEPTSTDPTRRTIVAGAAWSIPVIATAIAAPLAAASQFVCPDFGAETGWVSRVVNPGQMTPRPDAGNGWITADAPRTYGWWGDNNTVGAGAPALTMTLTKQIPVVAGKTYTFNWGIRTTYGTAWTPTNLTAQVGGQTHTDQSNASNVPQNGSATNFAARSFTYTATTTGTIPFVFTFRAPGLNAAGSPQQDIRIRFPANATVCTG